MLCPVLQVLVGPTAAATGAQGSAPASTAPPPLPQSAPAPPPPAANAPASSPGIDFGSPLLNLSSLSLDPLRSPDVFSGATAASRGVVLTGLLGRASTIAAFESSAQSRFVRASPEGSAMTFGMPSACRSGDSGQHQQLAACGRQQSWPSGGSSAAAASWQRRPRTAACRYQPEPGSPCQRWQPQGPPQHQAAALGRNDWAARLLKAPQLAPAGRRRAG